MANSNLSVSPEVLRAYSSKFAAYSQTLTETDTNLFSDAKNLTSSDWIGDASKSFMDQIEALLPYLKQAEDLTAKFSTQLFQAAEVYDSNESAMVSKFTV